MQCFVIACHYINRNFNFLLKRDNFETQNKLKINFGSYTEADSAPETVAWSCSVEKVF